MELPANTQEMGFCSSVAPLKHCPDFTALSSSWFLFSSFSQDSSHPWLCGWGLFLALEGHLQLMSHRQLPAAIGVCCRYLSRSLLILGVKSRIVQPVLQILLHIKQHNKAYFQSRKTLNWMFQVSIFLKLFLLKYKGQTFQSSTG